MRRMKPGKSLTNMRNLVELEALARRRLPNFVFEYIYGGAEDETSMHNNRDVFKKYRFVPHTLTDVSKVDVGTSVFGHKLNMPVGIGPTGFNGLITHDGDLKLARAAAACSIPFALSTVATNSLEDVATVADGWPWMQVYFLRDRKFVAGLVSRCKRAGYDTLVVTTDSAIYGNREWDARNYSRPFVLNWRNKFDVVTKTRWMIDVLYPHGLPTFKNLGDLIPAEGMPTGGAAAEIGKQHMPSLNWDDVKWLRDGWRGKLVLKGILSVDEAVNATRFGVDGIVVSNHGGRQLDGAVSPIELLEDMRGAVGDSLTIMVDSGFRRGTDIVKALALGADMVLLGRPMLFALAAGGENGVRRALGMLRADVHRTLGLLGCRSVAELNSDLLVR